MLLQWLWIYTLTQVPWYILHIYSVIQFRSYFSTGLRCTHASLHSCTQAKIPLKNVCHSSKASFISICIFVLYLLFITQCIIHFLLSFWISQQWGIAQWKPNVHYYNELPKLLGFGVHILSLAGHSFWQELDIFSYQLYLWLCNCLDEKEFLLAVHPARKKTSLSTISAMLKLPVGCRHLNQGCCPVIAIARRKGTFQLNIPEAVHGKSLCLFASLIEKKKKSLIFNHMHSLILNYLCIYNSLWWVCLHTALGTAKMICLSIIFFQKGN